MPELDESRPRRMLWLALLSGMATGYLGLMGLYLFLN
jgi:hypothetical protein